MGTHCKVTEGILHFTNIQPAVGWEMAKSQGFLGFQIYFSPFLQQYAATAVLA